MAITLAELVYSELIGLVQRTRVSYPACFNKIRLTENMVDKRESYTKEDLLASGRGELFGAKGPQLPAPNMLMMDRVVKMTETGGNFDKGYVEAELDINPDLWFFGCHFIGDPVMPGCLGLDAMWQLVGFYLGWLGGEGKGRALGVGEVKFTGQVLPTAKKVTYRIFPFYPRLFMTVFQRAARARINHFNHSGNVDFIRHDPRLSFEIK